MGFSMLHATQAPGQPIRAAGVVEFFDHFIEGGYCPDAALANESDPAAKFSEVADRGAWLVTRDGAPTIKISDAEIGGVLTVTTGSRADDFVSMQLNGEAFSVQAGTSMMIQSRIKIRDADD